MAEIRVLIVDDHTLMRSGLKLMLDNQLDIQVVGEAADGREALVFLAKQPVDIVLLDISMPDMGGLECLTIISEKYPTAKVILLTMYEDDRYLRDGIAGGAMGYVLKKTADDGLYQAIRTVFSGAMYLPQRTRKALIPKTTIHAVKPLSEKEKQVLEFIVMGYSNAEIAEKMIISVRTVETYKYRIMEKLSTRKRSDLVKFAMESGLVKP